MEKKGLILKLLGLIFILIIVFVAGAIYFFYNIYTYKTLRVCIDGDNDTKIPCTATPQCNSILKIDEAKNFLTEKQAPDIIKKNFNKIVEKSISCKNQTCHVRTVRGIDLNSLEIKEIDSCKVDEEEILINVKGKDLFGLLKFMKAIKNEK